MIRKAITLHNNECGRTLTGEQIKEDRSFPEILTCKAPTDKTTTVCFSLNVNRSVQNLYKEKFKRHPRHTKDLNQWKGTPSSQIGKQHHEDASFIASQPLAKIKCSICSYQFNKDVHVP